MTTSRRQFLRGAAQGLGLLTVSSTFPRWLGSAQAASNNGYEGSRAAVCVFLLGGCDTNNVLVPLQGSPYAQYRTARPTLGLPLNKLLTLNPQGLPAGAYGLHESLPQVRKHFNEGRAAFVCNVGPLVRPTDQAKYHSTTWGYLPDGLFSHADQQDAWASAVANPSKVSETQLKLTGWGGRTADQLHGLNTVSNNYPEVTSFGGKARFCAGLTRQPMMVASDGGLAFKTTGDEGFDTLRKAGLEEVMAVQDGNLLETAYGTVFSTAQLFAIDRMNAREAAWSALSPTTSAAIDQLFQGAQPGWVLATQLYQVVRDLVAGAFARTQGGLGLKRQLFSVGLGGFDTHQNQLETQKALLAQLDFSLDAFQRAMVLLEADPVFGQTPPQATLFTMSDFSRTLVENSAGGTDHGWGGHALVLGSRVAGGKLYGTFPSLDLASGTNPDTTDEKGRWIPTTCVEQYGYTLASWLGLATTAERDAVFPNLAPYIAASAGFPPQAQLEKLDFMKPG